jgi:hypothetical protein
MERRSDLLGGVDPDAVAERAAGCRSVARLSAGPVGVVATYLPGRRIEGVRLADGQIEVHVVAWWGARVPDLAAEVRAAVGPIAAGFPVDVHVDDVDVPEEGDDIEIDLPDGG